MRFCLERKLTDIQVFFTVYWRVSLECELSNVSCVDLCTGTSDTETAAPRHIHSDSAASDCTVAGTIFRISGTRIFLETV